MPLYEHVFIARQELSPQQVEELAGQFSQIITDNGGTVGKTEQWGLRNLAYKIKKNRKGHYVLLNIDAPATALQEMERIMRINDDVIRLMTIRVDELEEGPSAMLIAKSSRDERGPRGDRDDRGPRGDRRPPRRAAENEESSGTGNSASAETKSEGDKE
jgi:small subunit ribosomal protein S6